MSTEIKSNEQIDNENAATVKTVKSKEQIEKENEIAAIVKSLEEAGNCACKEMCVAKVLGIKEAHKTMSDTKHKCKCDATCLDDVLGTTSNYVRALSKPPYTDWNGVLTCPSSSVFADHLTEFKPEKVKEGDDKEIKDKIIEKNQKKGVRFTHNGQEMIRGYWMSPAPEFWKNHLIC
jgi:hypothetical protein